MKARRALGLASVLAAVVATLAMVFPVSQPAAADPCDGCAAMGLEKCKRCPETCCPGKGDCCCLSAPHCDCDDNPTCAQ